MHSSTSELLIFAHRLRSLRLAYAASIDLVDLTAAEFARMLSVAPAEYTAFEEGLREPPMSVLLTLHRKTGVSLDWLVAHESDHDTRLSA